MANRHGLIAGATGTGKTVTLKTIGLFTLMTQCGLMLPCEDGTEISVFKKVLADIGDEQSIEQSLSTFSSHIKNIISILEYADKDTLVLFDELCAGTDPIEGAALAKAILIDLFSKNAKTVATTHYPELKVYALDTEGVENASCEFDVSTLKPTYNLIIGQPGRSNAFAISLRLGMGEEIIERAKSLVSSDKAEFESVIESLENSRQEYERQREITEQLKAEAEREKAEAKKYKDSIEEMRRKELEKAQSQALKIVEQAKRSAYALTAELEKLKKERNSEFSYYDMGNTNHRRMYFAKLGEYQINYKEWESIIKKVNLKESGLSELFSNAKDEKGLVEKWFLDAIENKLNVENSRIKGFQSLAYKFIRMYRNNQSKIQQKSIMEKYFEDAKVMDEAILRYLAEHVSGYFNPGDKNLKGYSNNNEMKLAVNKIRESK